MAKPGRQARVKVGGTREHAPNAAEALSQGPPAAISRCSLGHADCWGRLPVRIASSFTCLAHSITSARFLGRSPSRGALQLRGFLRLENSMAFLCMLALKALLAFLLVNILSWAMFMHSNEDSQSEAKGEFPAADEVEAAAPSLEKRPSTGSCAAGFSALRIVNTSNVAVRRPSSGSDAVVAEAPVEPPPAGAQANAFARRQHMQLVARGGFGEVYTDGIRAFKFCEIPDAAACLGMELEFLFQRSVGAVSPCVVQAHSLDFQGSECCIAMELCASDVAAYLKTVEARRGRPGLREVQALQVFQQMVDGAAACHTRGVVHSDIKPQNYLLSLVPASPTSPVPEGSVKLADFGMAFLASTESGSGPVGGSCAYAAPELQALRGLSQGSASESVDGECHVDVGPAADVWSLGVTLCELLDGLCAPAAEHQAAMAAGDRSWRFVSFATKALVQDMLQEDPRRRPSAAQLQQRLRAHPCLVPAAAPAAWKPPRTMAARIVVG